MLLPAGVLRRYRLWFEIPQRLADVFVVYLTLRVICYWNDVDFGLHYQIAALFSMLLVWIVMGISNAYRHWRGVGFQTEVKVLVGSWLGIVFILLSLAWFFKITEDYSRLVIGYWFVTALIGIVFLHFLTRLLLYFLRQVGRNVKAAVVVGSGKSAQQLIERIHDAPWLGIRLEAIFDDNTDHSDVCGIPFAGVISDVGDYVKDKQIEYVYLALPMSRVDEMVSVSEQLQDATASLFIVPDIAVFELLRVRMQDVNGLPVLVLTESPFFGPFGALKRFEDIVLASMILLLVAPLMVLIALGVKLTSRGPVIFVQKRYGLDGNEILIWKFRSMKESHEGDNVKQAVKGDSRVTAFGAFIRKNSLDELPQLINVLQGRMSLVGPRPHAVSHNEQYRKLIKGYMWRHKVKPGITGWAQVNGWRGATETLDKMEKRVEHDIEYLRSWTLFLDIKIIVMTVFKAIGDRNAY